MRRSTIADVLHDIRTGFACGANPTNGVLQFRMNNVSRDGSLDFSKTRRVPRDTKKLQEFMLAPGDILFNITNSTELVGKTAFIQSLPEPTVFSNHFFRLRPHGEKVDGRYLSLWLQKLFAERVFEGMCRQWVGQATINRDQFLAIEIPLPSVTEQRRLAAILDQAEALRAQRRAAIAQLDSLGQAIFVEMFGDPMSNRCGWPISALENLVDPEDSLNYGVVQPGDDVSDGIPLIRVSDLKDGGVCLSSLKKIAPEVEATYKRSRLRGDEVLLSCVGSIGFVALVDKTMRGFNIARAIARIPLSGGVDRIFVAEYLKSVAVQNYFTRELRTVSQPTLNIKQICETKMVLPPLDLQKNFARRVEVVEELKRIHRRALGKLDTLFASLQHRAFRGELTRRTSTLEDLQKLEAEAGLEALIFVAKRTAKHDLYVIGKTLYMADKHHLEQHGRLIYGETHEALPMGPVPKAAYDTVKFLRGDQLFSSFDEASARAAIRVEGNRLVPLRDADLAKLGADAVKSLEWAIRYMDGATFEQAKAATHDAAWQRTQPNAAIALEHIIELLPAQARQRHWGL